MEADDDDDSHLAKTWKLTMMMDGWVEQILSSLPSTTSGESPSDQLFLASKLASVRYLAI
jgi:hypothetical protein